MLTEKLMGHSVHECKEMGRVAKETNKLLATGHQRHYSILYDNAVHTIGKAKLLGDLHSIRAQWHRGNLPGNDSWKPAMPGDASLVSKLEGWKKISKRQSPRTSMLCKKIAQLTAQLLDAAIDPAKFGYTQITLPDGSTRTPLEELIRWRLWNRTGGGLMAELGSHQLDAAGIFVSAMRGDGTKVRPLSVTAVGGRQIFPADREIDDHVYCMFEYPAPGYEEDKNKKIVVTYSSINGNGFGDYGEVVMGTKGTLVLEREQDVMLYKGSNERYPSHGFQGKRWHSNARHHRERRCRLRDRQSRSRKRPAESWLYRGDGTLGVVHSESSPDNQPRCKPEVAIADAVIAAHEQYCIGEARGPWPNRLQARMVRHFQR